MFKHRLLFEWLAILLLAIGSAVVIGNSDVGRQVNNFILDSLINRSAPAPSDTILIVEIDDRSLNMIGRWPWPRTVHAKAIRELASNAPKVVTYDVLFTEASSEADDAELAKAIGTVPTAIPLLYQVPGLNGATRDTYWPIEPLRGAAAAIGNVALQFGDDGVVRTMVITGIADGLKPHLMEQTFRLAEGGRSPLFARLERGATARRLAFAGHSNEVIIPFQSAGAFRTVSFANVLSGEVPKEFIAGKIVLVGVSALGLGDNYAVPPTAGSTMPGVEIQANFLNGLMTDTFLTLAPPISSTLLAACAVLALMIAFLMLRPTTNLALSLLVMGACIAISAILASAFKLWLPPVPTLVGVLVAYPIWGWRRLSALSRAVGTEIINVEAEIGLGPRPKAARMGFDQIAAQASELRSLVGKLSEIQAFTANLVNSAPEPMCVLDAGDCIILVNSSAKIAFGADPTGMSAGQALSHLTDGATDVSGEITARNGKSYLVNRTALAQITAGSAAAILQLADITQIKEAQREREDMLEFLSHDMRSPQAAIITLTNSQSTGTPAEVKLARIREHARLTLKLADDFVQLARLNAVEMKLEQVDLASLVAEAIDRNHTFAQERSVRLVSQGLETEAFINADPWALHRALSNLIDNAIKYGPTGGTVSCCLELKTARGGPSQPRDVILSITDEGAGIPAEQFDALFAKFGANDRKQRISAGLGLAFVKRVVDRLGGTIEHAMPSEGGTGFRLIFDEQP